MARLAVKRERAASTTRGSQAARKTKRLKGEERRRVDSEDEEIMLPLPCFPRPQMSYPDRVLEVQKAQVRAGRKVELLLDDLLRTRFRSLEITLDFVPEIHENERHFIPQPCPKVWRKEALKTITSGTAVSHLAVLKELKRGNITSQVNACILGKLSDPSTGERAFFTNYKLYLRLEAFEGPNFVLPFEVTVVTSHNGGNNTSKIDVPSCLNMAYQEVEPSTKTIKSEPVFSSEASQQFSPGATLYEEILLPELSTSLSSENERPIAEFEVIQDGLNSSDSEDGNDYDQTMSFYYEEEGSSLFNDRVTLISSEDAEEPSEEPSEKPHASQESSSSSPGMDELWDWVEIPRDSEICLTASGVLSEPLFNSSNTTSLLECVF